MVFLADELARATNYYSHASLIGKGGFGKVYKGTLRKCMTVAIKVLTQVSLNYSFYEGFNYCWGGRCYKHSGL